MITLALLLIIAVLAYGAYTDTHPVMGAGDWWSRLLKAFR